MFTLNRRISKYRKQGPILFSIISYISNIKYFTDKTTHYTIPSADPHKPKKGVKKHKEHQQGKIKEETETPLHENEDCLLLKFPVHRQDPYVRDIPKVDRHKEDKGTSHKLETVQHTKIKYKDQVDRFEDEVEIPELLMGESMTPNTPTTKVKVIGVQNEKIKK